ncbi:MAG: hypothetical protein OYL97_05920 [Candidatus Poribacteria bacterium]|nr:hypothetical protein [Candidatus Poribacteria bacterium]
MTSLKWTFSLASLVMLIAIGLVFAPIAVDAHKAQVTKADGSKFDIDPAHPKLTLSVSAAHDLSSADGVQVMRPAVADDEIIVQISSDQIISVAAKATDAAGAADANALDILDFVIVAFDKDGLPLTVPNLNLDTAGPTLTVGNPNNGKNAILTISQESATNWAMIDKLFISVKREILTNANPALTGDERPHAKNFASNRLTIQLVGADDGDPEYAAYGEATNVAAGTPGVVSITRVLDRSGFDAPVGVPFNVRIILTEKPKEFTKDHVMVEGGGATVGAPVMGSPIELPMNADGTALAIDADFRRGIGGGYATDGDATATDVPKPTGNDDMFYQYLVTITPNAGVDAELMVSVKQFEDQLLPQSKMYIPLLTAQRTATGLGATEEGLRDARVTDGREVLSVMVHTIEDAKVAGAKAAYDARQKVFDAIGNEIVLGNKLYIPAGGFLVLVADRGKAGIADPKSKTKEKLTAAQKLYNVTGLGLPFPADDLDNFFRNGGTLNLAYADIPAATGSGHGDSKGPTGDDATGYTAADSTAYAAGALMISEIMWGLDDGTKDSQYIELHNPGTAAIGIDNKEWVITVGSVPSGFTVIDTVGNNPATGFWQVPGQGGISGPKSSTPDESGGQAEVPAVIAVQDLISMSRVMGGTDGTAMASWKASVRPSSNLSGRRIGTPGAANMYAPDPVAPTPPPPPPPTPPTPTAVAMKDDIDITEIMFDSGNGRFPQWIELTNQAAGEVSLDGWMLNIMNDPADADVLGSSLMIDLSGHTLGVSAHPGNMGKGQSLLVIAFSGRGSDNLDNVAIIDASSADQLAQTGRYLLLSETAFKIVLMPPQATGVTVYGDMAGNLANGAAAWALPMAEGMRSSLIRMEMDTANMATMGTAANGWREASMTDLASGQITWYGSDEDAGTPGYDAGGPLPVELSMFYPKRDQLTGQVVIKWETQSELNNAGFFIKRSEAKDGEFKVINPTMIQGAGTTSEKQSYTYTDTSAKPNVVYYYQIEDVSLDGQRQTLTLGTRLRGHIGAAGKLTTKWGELKSQE